MRRTGVLVAGLALLLSGCVEKTNTGDGLPQQEANSVDELAVSMPGSVDVPSGMKRVAGKDADLHGPHFTIDVDWIATGPMIKQRYTPSVSGLTARRAADGQELLLVAVSGEETNGQFTLGDRKAPTAEFVVNGKKTPLDRLPLPPRDDTIASLPADGALLIASVPRDAKASLEVTDEGRTQSVDLRTGKQVKPVEGYYGPNRQTLSFSKDMPLTFAGGAVTLQILDHAMADFTEKAAMLAPWTPGEGWAKDDHTWLVIPRPVLSTPLMMDMTGLRLTIDDAVVFSVDGRPELGGTHTIETLAGIYTATIDPLVFDVQADFTGGTFTVNVAAMGVTAQYYTGDRVVTLAPPPAPFTVALSFT